MIIVKVDSKGPAPIEKALRKLKKKFDQTKVGKKLRERKEYKKPSVRKREKKIKAIYLQEKYGGDN
jgi:small subunit ribosomal protein S21